MARTFQFGNLNDKPSLVSMSTSEGNILPTQSNVDRVSVISGDTITALENPNYEPAVRTQPDMTNNPSLNL